MTDMTCCPLSSSSDDDRPECFSEEIATARTTKHCCFECGDAIPKGAKYERASGKWDGSFTTYKTCLSCVEIRAHFGCEGWIYGELWTDLEENFFPDMTAGGPCMVGLSPEAKGRLFELRLAWRMEQDQ